MSTINRIIHQNKLVEGKVNFFADYFQFAVDVMGVYDFLELENPLSIVEKIIFQIEHNKVYCLQYINVYLSHPLLRTNKYLSVFKHSDKVLQDIQDFFSSSHKAKMLVDDYSFLTHLKLFRRELKQTMFKKSLLSIVSFLKCTHELLEHQAELVYCTNILVSEFMLNNRSKKDLGRIFHKILAYENETKKEGKTSNREHLSESIGKKQRTFDEQFLGIYSQLNEKKKKESFIFRVYGLEVPSDFSFKYNRVEFFHPDNRTLLGKFKRAKKDSFLKRLINQEKSKGLILAIVRVEYHSKEIAIQNAIRILGDELKFLNSVCKSNAYLEKYSFISTNFKDYNLTVSAHAPFYSLSKEDINKLNDNPYVFLKGIEQKSKDHFFKYEAQFVEAMSSRNTDDYWKYLENLLPKNDNNKNEIISTVSSLLLLNAEKCNKRTIREYIRDAITPFLICDPETLGITEEQHLFYYRELKSNRNFDFGSFKSNIKHPFLLYLVNCYEGLNDKTSFSRLKFFYSSVLWEAKAQRNMIIHSDIENEKSVISLKNTLPRLITRFRWSIFNRMEMKLGEDFKSLISDLKKESDLLC